MADQSVIPDFSTASDAPVELLMLGTFSRSERNWIGGQPDLARDLRTAEPDQWSDIIENARAARRNVQPAAVPEDEAGMRRQALHDLHEAACAYGALTDGRRCELFRLVCRLAKYVTHRILQTDELRVAFQDAANRNGALARYGQGWFDGTIARAVEAGRNDKLPPLARRFRKGRGR